MMRVRFSSPALFESPLVNDDRATITLQLVRTVPTVAGGDDLGLHLRSGLLGAASAAGAAIDIDEYGA